MQRRMEECVAALRSEGTLTADDEEVDVAGAFGASEGEGAGEGGSDGAEEEEEAGGAGDDGVGEGEVEGEDKPAP